MTATRTRKPAKKKAAPKCRAKAAPPLPPMPGVPSQDAAELARTPFGVSAGKDGAQAQPEVLFTGKTVENSRGVGVVGGHDARIVGISSGRNYIAAKLASSDSLLALSTLDASRDVGVWNAKDAGNNCVIGVHTYGNRAGGLNEGGSQFQWTGGTIADNLAGAVCLEQSRFSAVTFKQNSVVDVALLGGDSHLNACEIWVQLETKEWNRFDVGVDWLQKYTGKIGTYLQGGGGIINGGFYKVTNWKNDSHTATGNPAKAIIVAADWCEIRTRIMDEDGLVGTGGILIEGQRKGLTVDVTYRGFTDPLDKPFAFLPGASVTGLRARFTVDDPLRSAWDYIPRGDWSGDVEVFNQANGHSVEARQ